MLYSSKEAPQDLSGFPKIQHQDHGSETFLFRFTDCGVMWEVEGSERTMERQGYYRQEQDGERETPTRHRSVECLF